MGYWVRLNLRAVSFGRWLGKDLNGIVTALYPLQLELDRAIHALPVAMEAYEAAEYGLYREAKREGVFL